MDEQKHPVCQSCAMPMKEDHDHGTESDSSKSEDYCHYCRVDGKFTDEGATAEEKIKKNVEMAVGMGMDEKEARAMAESMVPNLKRWKK